MHFFTRLSSVALAVLLVALPAAAEPNLQEGQWEITVTVEMEGMAHAIPPQTRSQCMTRKDLIPDPASQGENCELVNRQVSGNTARWRVACRTPQGTMDGTDEITYAGDSLEGEMRASVTDPSGSVMRVRMKHQGHRTGPCE